MLGYSRTVKGGRTIFYEFMRLEAKGSTITYHARIVPGSSGTPFTLTRFDGRQADFENPAHDFPQRISYRLISHDQIAARIDGMEKGKPKAVDFPMRRTACE